MALLTTCRGPGSSRAALCMLLVSLSMGCTVTRGVGDFPARDGGFGQDAETRVDAGAAGEVEPTLDDPDGWWLVFAQDRQCIYGVGDPLENLVRSTYVVNIRREDAGAAFLRQRVRMCAHELSPLHFGFVTVVGSEIPDAQPTHDVAGFLLGREAGSAYVTDEVIDNWGLTGQAADARLPDDPDDPRVVDEDEDGLPGVSVTVTTPDGIPVCSVRLIERLRVALDGAVLDGRQIAGRLISHIDQVVLSADTDLCSNGDLAASLAETRFDMVRVDGKQGGPNLDADRDGEVDCVEIREGLESALSFYDVSRLEPDSAAHCP